VPPGSSGARAASAGVIVAGSCGPVSALSSAGSLTAGSATARLPCVCGACGRHSREPATGLACCRSSRIWPPWPGTAADTRKPPAISALEISEQIGDKAGISISYRDLGNLAYVRDDHDEAIRCYHRALDIDEQLGNQAGIAGNSWQLGMVAQSLGDYEEAARQFERARHRRTDGR
jgi:tetratricopeptide (TPR) repeat protein